MTFVHATTSDRSRRPLESFVNWGAWPVALATAVLADRALTALDRFVATADLHRGNHARGIDGTHNFASVLMLCFGPMLEAIRSPARSPAA